MLHRAFRSLFTRINDLYMRFIINLIPKNSFSFIFFIRIFSHSFFLILIFRLNRMEAFVQTCQFHPQDAIHFGRTYINESIYNILIDQAPSFNDTFDYCEWMNEVRPCSQLFSPVLTSEGLCFSFNTLNSREIYTKA